MVPSESPEFYEGIEKNEILSLKFDKPTDRSMILAPFEIICPFDKFKENSRVINFQQ